MANGDEPDWTYPTPPTPKEVAVRPRSCIDYIWLFGALGTISARTVFDQPAAHHRTLFPSDHLGIMATVEV
jgi:hypothetical protein